MHGLISGLAARSHEVSVLSLASPAEDLRPLTAETSIYASQVTVVPSPAWGMSLRERRIAQLRSRASLHSFEWHQHLYPPLQAKLDQLLRREEREHVIGLCLPHELPGPVGSDLEFRVGEPASMLKFCPFNRLQHSRPTTLPATATDSTSPCHRQSTVG